MIEDGSTSIIVQNRWLHISVRRLAEELRSPIGNMFWQGLPVHDQDLF